MNAVIDVVIDHNHNVPMGIDGPVAIVLAKVVVAADSIGMELPKSTIVDHHLMLL